MSKFFKRSALIFLVCLALFCAAISLFACSKATARSSGLSPIYYLNVSYDEPSHTLFANQELLLNTPETLDEGYIALRLYANAISDDNCAIDILSAKINRQTVDFEICGDKNSILKLPYDQGGETVDIALCYNVKIPKLSSRFGYGDNFASLNLFYPSLAVYEDGWHEEEYCEVGDPFFFECADFYVSLTLADDLAVACSGETSDVTYYQKDGKNLKDVEIYAQNIRDFGLVVGDFSSVSLAANKNSVAISYYYMDDADPLGTIERAKSAIELFGAAFGAYPYPTFCFAQTPLDGAGGMEYGAFATISPASREYYLDAVTHEIAHQWWYGAVGNNQIENAWMDEGLSEFCTYFYNILAGDPLRFLSAMSSIERSYGDYISVMRPVGFDASMRRPLSTYLSSGEYVAVVYQKGALMFKHIYDLIGEKNFVAALKTYCESNKYAIASPASLLAAFKSQGFDISPILSSWIDNKDK